MWMKQAGTILIVDDNPDILIAVKLILKQYYENVITTDNPFDIEKIISIEKVDVILLDMNFNRDAISGQEGFYWLKKITKQDPTIAVIFMTAYSAVKIAVDAIKAGATDFLAKPWENEQLLAVVAAALSHAKDKQQLTNLTRQTQGLNHALKEHRFEFLGQSPAMMAVFKTIEKAAQTDANILITGESGTGKELAARAIHLASSRKDKAFISVDMGAIAESLFESELFGHKKGAFTDAKADKVGRFELADNGSLFLDELANLPLNQQTTLLAALQNRQVTPVGGTKTINVDIRLICATNENLQQAVASNHFRQDLLFRINTIEICLPPLRERIEDIPLLVEYYLNYFNQKYKRTLNIKVDALNSLCQYRWPGNVRELAHAIERAVILSDGEYLDISSVIATQHTTSLEPASEIYDTFNLDILEQRAVRAALKSHQGNVTKAAKSLGLTRGAMYRRLEKYDL